MNFIKAYYKGFFLVLVSLALLTITTLFAWAWSKLPNYDGRISIEGLQGEVEILRDSYGMAHIYAQNDSDLYLAFGYVTAQDRLFQMDLMRRAVRGELAEIFGRRALKADKLFRIITSVKGLDEILQELSPQLQKEIRAYTKGVNHFIQTASLPIEFSLLGYKPEPWRMEDTVTPYYLVAWALNTSFVAEALCALLVQQLGEKDAQDLCLYDTPLPSKSKMLSSQQTALSHFIATDLAIRDTFQIGRMGGSNNWVVSGERSNTGSALLANDPHLPFNLPGFFYEAHLISPSQNVSGSTTAGVPTIFIGMNTKAAWSFTLLGEDASDLYYETLDPKDSDRYLVKDRFVDMRVLQQNIRIKGEKDQAIKIRITRHGPIINDLLDDNFVHKGNQAIAMRWTAYEHYSSIEAIYNLNKAKDINDIERAAQYYKTPGLNWIYADTKGNIGYTPAVCAPSRKKLSRAITSGWC